MRHAKVTTTYVIEVPDDEASDASIEAVMMRGISVMEEFIKSRATKARDVQSHWQWMPKEYSRKVAWQSGGIEKLPEPVRVIPHREPGEVSFTQDILGDNARIAHPWDQGLWIFPEDHPYRVYEERYRPDYLVSELPEERENAIEGFKQDVRELEAGKEE